MQRGSWPRVARGRFCKLGSLRAWIEFDDTVLPIQPHPQFDPTAKRSSGKENQL
jgi:hypothetical protein